LGRHGILEQENLSKNAQRVTTSGRSSDSIDRPWSLSQRQSCVFKKLEWDMKLLPSITRIMDYIPSNTHQDRILQIETARVRHAWAKSQVTNGEATPALLKYLKASLEELAALRANDAARGDL
jgi:hypothetical protein